MKTTEGINCFITLSSVYGCKKQKKIKKGGTQLDFGIWNREACWSVKSKMEREIEFEQSGNSSTKATVQVHALRTFCFPEPEML